MLPLNSAYGKSLVNPGRRAKLDLTHPAAQNLRFAGIAASGNFINMFQGSRGTVAGTPSALSSPHIGQATTYTGSTDNSTFAGQLTAADPSATIAAIFIFTGTTNFRTVFLNSVGNTGWTLQVQNTTNTVNFGAQGSAQVVGPVVSPNIPYFVVGSSNPGAIVNNAGIVVRRLDTGAMTVVGNGNGLGNSGATSGTYQVGNDTTNSRPLTGSIAAVMYSATNLTIPQMVKMADDPWGFWYATEFGPQNFPFILANGPGGAGTTVVQNTTASMGAITRSPIMVPY
jgi:hypothetical protein